ncbi:MAG: Hpt domain-containing protein [Saprospiraceae bacterium]
MIDRTRLESLLASDPKLVTKFLSIFKNQTPDQLNTLSVAVADGNWDQASITAHAIKSQCKYVGLDELADFAQNIEQLTEEKHLLHLIPGLVAELKIRLLTIIERD